MLSKDVERFHKDIIKRILKEADLNDFILETTRHNPMITGGILTTSNITIGACSEGFLGVRMIIKENDSAVIQIAVILMDLYNDSEQVISYSKHYFENPDFFKSASNAIKESMMNYDKPKRVFSSCFR